VNKALKKKAWTIISEYVRRKDADHNGYVACYTCGAMKHWKEGDAGHAIPGRHNKVLFDLEILRFQCKHCNGPKSGMQYEFGKRLNLEHGEGWFEQKVLDSKGTVKIYDSDLADIIAKTKEMLEDIDENSNTGC
jgi:hypothetical protein